MISVHTDTALPMVHVTSSLHLLLHIKTRRIHELLSLYIAFKKIHCQGSNQFSHSQTYGPQEMRIVPRTCHYCITDDTQHVMLFILQGRSLSSTTCGSTVGDAEFMLVPVALGSTS